ncbi:hypothetical protein GQ43DRAFT_415408 [Delitschia confertaspora ATCC 74209]|uniref:Secreted protein n=1 Tax=Delitschia confertaspora ATCC 74209 TaxID=1513339 RepID=A0A9P4JM78_9PLEO|nr:hypothetical protein GQ43DRAFT_415408 [Delitschia confertaspora ATCC 74209]
MKVLGLSFALATLAVATPVPSSASASAPSSFRVGKVAYGGSGCPQGTLNVDISSDGRILPIHFGKEFAASVGPNSDPADSRKNCQLNFDLQFSPGYQYTVLSTDYTGFADLNSGVKGKVKSTYYFSGEQDQATAGFTLNGPFTGQYTKHDDVALAVWSPCGSSSLLNVNTEVALTPLTAKDTGLLTTDKASAKFTHSLYINWRQC